MGPSVPRRRSPPGHDQTLVTAGGRPWSAVLGALPLELPRFGGSGGVTSVLVVQEVGVPRAGGAGDRGRRPRGPRISTAAKPLRTWVVGGAVDVLDRRDAVAAAAERAVLAADRREAPHQLGA